MIGMSGVAAYGILSRQYFKNFSQGSDAGLRFLWSYLKKYTGEIAAVMGTKLLGTILELLIPCVLEYMIDDVAPRRSVRGILFWGILMLLLAVLVRFVSVSANRKSVQVAQKTTYAIRRDLFARSISLSGSQMDAIGLPSLISRMTSDTYNVQNFIQTIQSMGIRAPIMLLGGIMITLTMDPVLASILCIMAPIMMVIVVSASQRGIPLYKKMQQSLDIVVRIMRETITGIRVVKALSREDYESERFRTANEALFHEEKKSGIVMSLPGPIMSLFLNIGLTAVIVLGACRVNSGSAKPGVILAFLTYFNMILMGVMGLNRIFMMLSKANASANRIGQVIELPEDLPRLEEEDTPALADDSFLRFDHVSFRYADGEKKADWQMNLTDIDFSLAKGGSLGIIGSTGSGKTTIINLLMRFYDVTQGHVFVDGKDVRCYDKSELRRKFGVVFQNDTVFADSIRQNIRFGRECCEERLRDAAMDACAAEFIERYADGYDHEAAIHGANFSGGQRQRVLLSRALAGSPEILVLDDASSALDYRTDAALRNAIRANYSGTTTIVIAQRISSIMSMDKILVLDGGRIIGYGNHELLLKTCSAYAEIFKTQMGESQ